MYGHRFGLLCRAFDVVMDSLQERVSTSIHIFRPLNMLSPLCIADSLRVLMGLRVENLGRCDDECRSSYVEYIGRRSVAGYSSPKYVSVAGHSFLTAWVSSRAMNCAEMN